MAYPLITKSSGEREAFLPEKLKSSLLRSGADEALAEEIVLHIASDLREGMPTSEIYRHAFVLLRKKDRPMAARYSLKRALMEFGPSGFPFERYIAHILESFDYQTQVGIEVDGACVTHEVDVLAENDKERIYVEAKFHNSPATKSDVKTALYIEARFRDIANKQEGNLKPGQRQQAWLITNTNFTSQAIQYANCVGLPLLGWNYPKGRTLQDLITETQMHPVTCLTTLTNNQKRALITEGKVLCRDLSDAPDAIAALGVAKHGVARVLAEVAGVCPLPTEPRSNTPLAL